MNALSCETPSIRRPSLRSVVPARVLLAEDDRDMREMIASALRADGHHVDEAADGRTALVRIARAISASNAYQLVISDIRMPICGGLEILEDLRRQNTDVPMILMTAFGDETMQSAVRAQGAILLNKPFDLDELRVTVVSMMEPLRTPSRRRTSWS
jgi:DNA-binding response OmpR family regulator